MEIKKQAKLEQQKIPVIDVSKFVDGNFSELEGLALQVRQAQEKVGYYYLIGGIQMGSSDADGGPTGRVDRLPTGQVN